MPHCIIEYAKEIEKKIDPASLLELVYQGVLHSGLFESADIKIRAIPYLHHQTGALKQDFIHLSLRILSGRSDEQKTLLSSEILTQLRSLNLEQISLTVEVIDIHRASYGKYVA